MYDPKITEGPHYIGRFHNGKDQREKKPPRFANDFQEFIASYALDSWLKDPIIENLAIRNVI